MWATLALTAALSMTPGQPGTLKLTNTRATHGYLGPTRADDNLLPGEVYFVHFDIEGLAADEQGNGKYSLSLALIDKTGKALYELGPFEKPFVNSLGGTRTPAYANVVIGTDTTPGDYTLKLTITDPATKKSEVLERKYKVLKLDFGLVNLHMMDIRADPRNQPSGAPIRVVGDAVVVNAAIVGFARDKNKQNQPNLGLEITVLDEKNKPTLAKSFTDQVVKDVPEQWSAVPISLPLALNRAGKYTIKLQATDRITKKTAEATLPVTVVEGK